MEKKIYKLKNYCRICKSKKLSLSFDLGLNPVGDDYTKRPNNSQLIPLEVVSCNSCGFKQLSVVVNQNRVYGDYLYTTETSKGLVKHFENSFKFLLKNKFIKRGDFVIDIGSNDGSNLNIYKKNKFDVLGVEPAKDLANLSNKKGIKTFNSFFSRKIANKILAISKKPKLICIYNLLANVDDLDEFVRNLLLLTDKNTYIAIESFSLYGIVKYNLFDNIYHEHLSYFYVENLQKFFKKFNLNIIYAENNKIKGGSIKLILSKNKNHSLLKTVKKVILEERKINLNKNKTFHKLIKKNYNIKINVTKLFNKFRNLRVGGYGASCGSTVLIHYYNLTNKFFLLFDDEKRRKNLYSPSTNIKVVNPNIKNLKQIDVIIIIAWRYKKNIISGFKKKFKNLKNKILFYEILPKIKKINF
jgi:hypothetical protein